MFLSIVSHPSDMLDMCIWIINFYHPHLLYLPLFFSICSFALQSQSKGNLFNWFFIVYTWFQSSWFLFLIVYAGYYLWQTTSNLHSTLPLVSLYHETWNFPESLTKQNLDMAQGLWMRGIHMRFARQKSFCFFGYQGHTLALTNKNFAMSYTSLTIFLS